MSRVQCQSLVRRCVLPDVVDLEVDAVEKIALGRTVRASLSLRQTTWRNYLHARCVRVGWNYGWVEEESQTIV